MLKFVIRLPNRGGGRGGTIDRMPEYCVTGGTGIIASYLVKTLLHKGCAVRATVRDPGMQFSLCTFLKKRLWNLFFAASCHLAVALLCFVKICNKQCENLHRYVTS